MQAQRISNQESQWIQRGLIAFAIIALLAVAAFVWGVGRNADPQSAAVASHAVARATIPQPVDPIKVPRPVDRIQAPRLRDRLRILPVLERPSSIGTVARVKVPPALDRFLRGGRGGTVARVKAPRPVDGPRSGGAS